MQDILQQVSGTLTAEPIEIVIDILPQNRIHGLLQKIRWLHRWVPPQRRYQLRPITYGNMVRISKLFLQIGVSDLAAQSTVEKVHDLMAHQGGNVVSIIAIALTNTRAMPSPDFEDFLLHNLTPKETLGLAALILQQLNIEGFLHTISLLKGTNVLESAGKKSSADAANSNQQMSPQVPGSSLDQLASISDLASIT